MHWNNYAVQLIKSPLYNFNYDCGYSKCCGWLFTCTNPNIWDYGTQARMQRAFIPEPVNTSTNIQRQQQTQNPTNCERLCCSAILSAIFQKNTCPSLPVCLLAYLKMFFVFRKGHSLSQKAVLRFLECLAASKIPI